MDLEAFFTSLPGQALVATICLALLAALYFLSPHSPSNSRIRPIATCAMLIACAFVSNNFLPRFHMPMGGSVTACSMLFLYLCGYLFGPRVGILAGSCYGLLDFLFSPSAYTPLQIVVDYPLAFGMIGAGSLLRSMQGGYYWGYLAGAAGRFFCSFLSGFVFFAEYAGDMNPVLYSAIYNISYIGVEAAITLAVMAIPLMHRTVDRVAAQYGFKPRGAV